MDCLILDGRTVAKEIRQDLTRRITELKVKQNVILASIVVGEEPSTLVYAESNKKACEKVGITPRLITLSTQTTTQELCAVIDTLNCDKEVCGIILHQPLPRHIDARCCCDRIARDKDIDCANSANFGALAIGQHTMLPSTPLSIMTILNYYKIPLEGKHAVVVGRSNILGKPVSLMLLSANATVTICHSKTADLAKIVKTADIVVACVGKSGLIKGDWIKTGAVIIDAGYNADGKGDVALDQCIPHCSAYTPVPGGIGPLTVACLLKQTVESAERRIVM